jgi:hypothetical protein
VDYVCELHRLPPLPEVGEVQDEAGDAHGDSQQRNAEPEPHFLAGVVLARRDVAALEKIADSSHPRPIVSAEEIVANESDEHQQGTHNEKRTYEVVQILPDDRD